MNPKIREWAPSRQEGFLLLVCSCVVALQTFVPPYIGIADNGDFAKIAGRLSLQPIDPDYRFKYFNADYLRSAANYWVSPVKSSELWPAHLASYLSRTEKEGSVFIIRWLGAIHASIFITVFYLFLIAVRPMGAWRTLILASAAVCIFTDVLYVAYFNSFYSDTAALLGLIGAAVFAVLIITREPSASLMIAFTVFAVLLIASKSQHALWVFLPVLFLLVVANRQAPVIVRLMALVSSAILLGVAFLTINLTPADYRGQALFNLIFLKLANHSSDAKQDLQVLGLSERELPYIGMTAYATTSPAKNPAWFQDFCRRTSYPKVGRFYLGRPFRVFKILHEDLHLSAPYLRFAYANFRRQDARGPQQMADRFSFWSSLRSSLFWWWPEHILVWYALLSVGILAILRAPVNQSVAGLACLTAGIAVAAVIEFQLSTLAEAVETFRHLFLFHALTDLTALFALAGLLAGPTKLGWRRHARCPLQ